MKTNSEINAIILEASRAPIDVDAIRARFAVSSAILQAAELVTELCQAELKGRSRAYHIARPRMAVMYLLLKHCHHLSTSQVGRMFGRDHTTVIHARDVLRDGYAAGGNSRTEQADKIWECAQEILAGSIESGGMADFLRAVDFELQKKTDGKPVAPKPDHEKKDKPKSQKFVPKHGIIAHDGAIICNP